MEKSKAPRLQKGCSETETCLYLGQVCSTKKDQLMQSIILKQRGVNLSNIGHALGGGSRDTVEEKQSRLRGIQAQLFTRQEIELRVGQHKTTIVKSPKLIRLSGYFHHSLY